MSKRDNTRAFYTALCKPEDFVLWKEHNLFLDSIHAMKDDVHKLLYKLRQEFLVEQLLSDPL